MENRWIDEKKTASLPGDEGKEIITHEEIMFCFMIFVLVMGLVACGSKNDGEGASQETAPESSVQAAGNESSADEDAGGTEAEMICMRRMTA